MQELATELLQTLLRFNTVNPPGDERELQEWLADVLRDAGFDDVALLGRTHPRPNLVARLKGHAPGPVLGLLSHVDTVLATPSEWQRDPWSGDIVDGEVWGRGAQDMKSQTACEVAAAVTLARSGWRPAKGDLLVLVMVDEETGGAEGARWLCETHPELVRCDYVLNEGAGTRIDVDGQDAYGVCVAEKGVFRFTLTTRGVAGHASMPGVADNALPKLAPLLEALAKAVPAFDVTEAPTGLLAELGLDPSDPASALAALRERSPGLAGFVEPMLAVTFAPTRTGASDKINVIPSSAWVKVDCRVPPGLGEEKARERIAEALDGVGVEYELTFDEEVTGNASPVDSPLMDALRGWLAREEPDAKLLPTMLPAFTDSRTWRSTFPECIAYGFFPQRVMDLPQMWGLIHAKDERIHVDDLGWAAKCFHDVTLELLG